MIVHAFSIFDEKAKSFSRPFYEVRVELAVRSVAAEVQNPESMMGKFPGDFTLYRLGTFNDESGGFELLPQPELIAKVVQLTGGK